MDINTTINIGIAFSIIGTIGSVSTSIVLGRRLANFERVIELTTREQEAHEIV
jgi:hypothetical protein